MNDAIRKEIDRMKACHDEPFATAIDILEATIVYLIRERDDLELQRKSLKWLAEDRMRKCNVAEEQTVRWKSFAIRHIHHKSTCARRTDAATCDCGINDELRELETLA